MCRAIAGLCYARSMRFGNILALGFLAAATTLAQRSHDRQMDHHCHERTAEEWIAILEQPDRDEWQRPDAVVQALALRPGEAVADIGAGSGYFSVRFARAVGPDGVVYAQDIHEGLVEHLENRARKMGLPNLKAVLGGPDDPRLPRQSVDTIFICDVIHHIENRQSYYSKLAEALRPGGRLVIVDFYKRELPVGPPPGMKIAKNDLVAELEAAGFRLAEEFDFLPYQYLLSFQRK